VLIVAYSLMAQEALRAAASLGSDGVEAAVLEVAQLAPLPLAALLEASRPHKRLLFVDESRAAGSPASHMMSRVLGELPGARARLCTTLDAPTAFAPELVDRIVPTASAIADAVRELLAN